MKEKKYICSCCTGNTYEVRGKCIIKEGKTGTLKCPFNDRVINKKLEIERGWLVSIMDKEKVRVIYT